MYKFPEGLYTDVRVESVFSTGLMYENSQMIQNKVKTDRGAFIRVYDGKRWFYSATSNLDGVQAEIDNLAKMACPNENILENPTVKLFEVNVGEDFKFASTDVSKIPVEDKVALAEKYLPELKCDDMPMTRLFYLDKHTEKHIVSSKGTDIKFDYQTVAVFAFGMLVVNGLPQQMSWQKTGVKFDDVLGQEGKIAAEIKDTREYAEKAVPVEKGEYTCILAPIATGVFTHESFGHKSEADFMIGDETMIKEWALGSRVGSDILSIVDTGIYEGSGYVPYDDEGTKAKYNYIIKNGILSGRLHSAYTASDLGENLTGNARAINFEFEPIVRMTDTFILPGTSTVEELFAGVKKGIYIKDISHGSGMSTFTIAPTKAYMIRDGKIAEPVKVSVISGNVMHTLGQIDGLSDKTEYLSFAVGGCGKMEQFPLPVGFGGPYMRVNGIQVL